MFLNRIAAFGHFKFIYMLVHSHLMFMFSKVLDIKTCLTKMGNSWVVMTVMLLFKYSFQNMA